MITIYSTFSIAILSYNMYFFFYYYYYYFVIVCILSASEWILSRYTALYK